MATTLYDMKCPPAQRTVPFPVLTYAYKSGEVHLPRGTPLIYAGLVRRTIRGFPTIDVYTFIAPKFGRVIVRDGNVDIRLIVEFHHERDD